MKLRGEEYEVNQEFQQGALQLADALELDEIEAAQLFLDAQGDDAISSGRSQLECSIIRFHNRRELLLDCLRISLELSQGIGQGPGFDDNHQAGIHIFVGLVLNAPQGSSQFIRKCLSTMGDCKKWLQDLTEKFNSASVLGQSQTLEFAEIFQFERLKLVRQHEVLGIIIYYLVKNGHSGFTDLEFLLNTVKNIDKYDNLLGELLKFFLFFGFETL